MTNNIASQQQKQREIFKRTINWWRQQQKWNTTFLQRSTNQLAGMMAAVETVVAG